MADKTPPLNEARLEAIRARHFDSHPLRGPNGTISIDHRFIGLYIQDHELLLAEVYRLRAENAAMRPIVEAVAAPLETAREHVCMCEGPYDGPHEPHCIVAQARAFVAQREGQGA